MGKGFNRLLTVMNNEHEFWILTIEMENLVIKILIVNLSRGFGFW